MGQNYRVLLKRSLRCAVPLLVNTNGMGKDPIAFPEPGNAGPNLNHLASEIASKDEGVLDPREQELPEHCLIQSIGLIETAKFLTTISFSRGGVYGAPLTSSFACFATSQAAVFTGIWCILSVLVFDSR